MNYDVIYSKVALKHMKLLSQKKGLAKNASELIEILKVNPFQNPPRYEKLQGDFDGFYSRRINIQHRLVYEVDEEKKQVKILTMWTHYEV